ncbi:MAG: tetratricopeptide repeat protein [Gammaproteobacteria bacterium]|jgi:tetratricopeptide (TPR) repeat protein|nr:tetratricopeptide repeat protein [Gammaproteobacteria bacterium]
MKLSIRLLLFPLSVLLTACAALPPEPAAPEAVPADATAPILREPAPTAGTEEPGTLSGALLFDILLGEVAGQRDRLDVSVSHYLRAAEESDDPRVAERALRIALFAKDEDAALTAARRWVELDPARLEARQSLAMLATHARIVDEAYEQLDYLVSAAPDDEQAYEMITGLLARSEDRELTLTLMERLTQAHPDSAEAHLAYSRLALHADNAELALSEVERSLVLRPGWADAIVLRAAVHMKLEQPEQARHELEAAIAAQPGNIDLRLALARLLLDLRDLSAAGVQFREVVRRKPDHADARFSLGLLAVEQKQYKQAEGHFRKLLASGQREQEARYYLGRVAELRDDKQGALDWYATITEGDYWLEAQIRTVDLQADLGDLPGARRHLQSLRLQDPRLAVRLYLVEGEILIRAGELAEAMRLYNDVLAEAPDNHEVLYARALLAERLGESALAERDLRRIVDADPDNFHALNALGYTLADRNERLEEALALIEKALTLAPDEAAIVDSMGWVQYRLGRLDAAVEHLQRAYTLSGEDPEVAAHLGEVLWVQGRHAEARRVWDKARREHPDNQPLQRTLERHGL